MDKNISTNDANHIDFQSEKKDLNQEESKEEENKDLSQEESKEEENKDLNQKESKEEENKDLNQKESKEEESIDLSDAEIEKIFNFLYQLIIQNIQNLIINYQTELFQFFFCPNSDIVTIITSFYYFSKNSKKMQIESGFSIEFVNNIYKKLEKMFETDNGCELIISAYEKFHNQKKDLLELIDSFIQNDISKNNLQLNECQATFFKVIDARMKKIPTLIYKMKTEDGLEKNIEISRPGFCKLESPRNIIVLAKYHDNKENIEHGVLLHRNINFDNNDYGVASHEFKHENYNFYFFNYLFQAYWSDRIIKDDFIEIYNTSLEDKNTSSIVNFTKSKFGSYLNYCPRNKLVQDLIQKRIKACLLLLVVFPNSIIFKHENPLCAIEFLGNNSNNYNTKIHIIDEERSDCPVAYPLNNMTLDFALTYYYKFKKTNQLRFSITGENFYYKEYQGREIESIFTNPNINSNNKSVFDSNCPSHIVLLIDNNFPHRPENIEPLSWIPKNEKELTENIHNKEMFDSNENQKILDISSQIISDFGKVEKQSDIFFITLSNSFPVVSKGSIPDYIRGLVGFDQSNGNIVKGGMHKLIKHFTKGLIKKQILSESIPLETISSTDHWKNYPKNEENILTILNKISVAIKNHFQIDDKNINIEFIGYSLILLHIKGLSESSVCHKIIDDIWNDEYIKCIADDEIKSILNDIQDIDLQVTNVFHERLNNIKVYNKKCLNLHKDEFIKRVNKVANMFGFLKLTISDYIENKEHNDISGYINVELMNSRTSITFASMINEEFRNEKESNSKIDTIRQIYAMNNNNNNNNEINIMIIPSTNDSLEHEILQHSIDSNCIGVCNEEKKYLPQYLYQYNFFGFKHAICKDCIFETFESMTDLQNSLNTQTYMIDREKMRKVYDLLPNFLFYKIKFYDYVPFAQNIWTLITENDLISHYVKLWFTLNMDILIRISPLYFVHCPHTIRRTPKDENVFICSKCNLIYHPKCQSYHFINEECTILKENEKRCPYCFAIAEKISGCNHVICESCNKHWCFKCEHSPIFDTASQCYDHMKIEHNESYIFSHEATHIYLNPQNENEIVKLERKKLYSWKCIPFDNELIIHDHQNGTELQICSYDEQNLFLNSLYDLPIITESIYDYDIVDFEDDVKYDFDDYRKRKYCKYFNYTISTNFIESDK